MELNKIYQGDVIEILKTFPDECIDCIVTSPPYYGLRDYGVKGQIGLEETLNEYLNKMLGVTGECKRVLKKTGTMWWNHGDSYGTHWGKSKNSGQFGGKVKEGFDAHFTRNRGKNFRINGEKVRGNGFEKCLLFQNYRLAIRMIDEQKWILRNVIIWHKPNVMPTSVKDRFTVDYEPIFFFSKSKKYWFEPQFEAHTESREPKIRNDNGKIMEVKEAADNRNVLPYARTGIEFQNPLGRNKRTVWKIATQPQKESHFATFPENLIVTPIKAGCPEMICKKCGKAREKIFNKEFVVEKEYKDKGKAADNVKNGTKEMPALPRARTGVEGHNEFTFLGYIDCGCHAEWDKGVVLDPFMGSGTTSKVAQELGRNWVGIELNESYIKIAEKRLSQQVLAI